MVLLALATDARHPLGVDPLYVDFLRGVAAEQVALMRRMRQAKERPIVPLSLVCVFCGGTIMCPCSTRAKSECCPNAAAVWARPVECCAWPRDGRKGTQEEDGNG
jgi:hypothetical protein